MQSLGNLLNFQSKKSPLMRGVIGAMAVEVANNFLISIFGEKAKDTCRAVYVKNKVLSIACLSSVLAQEIKLRERQIIDGINKKLGGPEVEKIRYLA